MARKFQNIAFGYAIPSYFHNIESTLHIYVHVYYITIMQLKKMEDLEFLILKLRNGCKIKALIV